MANLERRLDELLYDGRWENMVAIATRYVGMGEQALTRGDLGDAQYYLERAKSILGMKDVTRDE